MCRAPPGTELVSKAQPQGAQHSQHDVPACLSPVPAAQPHLLTQSGGPQLEAARAEGPCTPLSHPLRSAPSPPHPAVPPLSLKTPNLTGSTLHPFTPCSPSSFLSNVACSAGKLELFLVPAVLPALPPLTPGSCHLRSFPVRSLCLPDCPLPNHLLFLFLNSLLTSSLPRSLLGLHWLLLGTLSSVVLGNLSHGHSLHFFFENTLTFVPRAFCGNRSHQPPCLALATCPVLQLTRWPWSKSDWGGGRSRAPSSSAGPSDPS